ncbi:unnamed protein product [Acanthoscelides obtectus]|uniref:Uncharacterized protein n=1 Tax=Acanthoscelides obtectus TaxID=200917 RepID=A0A9P0LJ03_ACAOB|nr:unnamed protein product [Acanthoscelides obtectus]CAK1669787.1 hypothetical protein AOBTE_LOCUS27249 [Acanthoscelides obtectus]
MYLSSPDGRENSGYMLWMIKTISIQFPAKYSYATAERRMLPLVLSWLRPSTRCKVVQSISHLPRLATAADQAYVALSRVQCKILPNPSQKHHLLNKQFLWLFVSF